MAEGGSMLRENMRSMSSRNSWSSDDIYKVLGERVPVLMKKSPVPTVDQGNVHQREATIVTSDMAEDMQQFAIECAIKALTRDKFINERDIASYIRRKMEEKYNPTWHCIVGHTFSSFVSHETKHYIHFSVGKMGILVFKSG